MGSLLATTGASGEGAVALDWICRHLAYELIVPSGHYLDGLKSAHNFDANEARGSAVAGMLAFWVLDDRQPLFQRGRVFVDRPEVWDRALGTPLWNLGPEWGPGGRSAHALGLKGTRIALGLGENLGRRGVATAACRTKRAVRGPELSLVRSHRSRRSGRRSGGRVVRRLAACIRDGRFPRFPRPCCALGRRRDGSSALRESRTGSQRRSGNRRRVPWD